MTFNELTAIFASDDLNPNAELVFHDVDRKFVIDDVADNDEFVSIYLGERDNEI